MTTDSPYQVRFLLIVDRPWLRGSTYQAVKTGARLSQTICCRTQGAAVRQMLALLAGEDDCYSEYVARVEVVQVRERGRPRCVRRPVERSVYRASGVIGDMSLARPTLAISAASKGRNMLFMRHDWPREVFHMLAVGGDS